MHQNGNSTAAPLMLLDGGLGTTLKYLYNAKLDGANWALWSSHLLISDPAKLLAVQTAFADAGADAITTATYQVVENMSTDD
jgi:homocysteine S-methyltransferase